MAQAMAVPKKNETKKKKEQAPLFFLVSFFLKRPRPCLEKRVMQSWN
jgi:hypothetical protein